MVYKLGMKYYFSGLILTVWLEGYIVYKDEANQHTPRSDKQRNYSQIF